jgi:hypothetical protein
MPNDGVKVMELITGLRFAAGAAGVDGVDGAAGLPPPPPHAARRHKAAVVSACFTLPSLWKLKMTKCPHS